MVDDLEVIDIVREIVMKRFTLFKGLHKRGMIDRCRKMNARQWSMMLPDTDRYKSTIEAIANQDVNLSQSLSGQPAPRVKKFSRTSCNGVHRLLTGEEVVAAMTKNAQDKEDAEKEAEKKKKQKVIDRENRKLLLAEKEKEKERNKLERIAKKKQDDAAKEKKRIEKSEKKKQKEAERIMNQRVKEANKLKRKKEEEAKNKATKKQKQGKEKERAALGDITNTISQKLYCYCNRGGDNDDDSLFWVCESGGKCRNGGFIHKKCHQLNRSQQRQLFWCTDCQQQADVKRSHRRRSSRKVCYNTSS